MFMRKMRESAKHVMLVLALAFVGWLVFEGINDMRGGGGGSGVNPVVGTVAGRDIRYSDWNLYLQNQLTLARQTGGSLNEEEVRLHTERAWETLISGTLIQAELERLGIIVTDDEIRQAFLTQPPPEMFSHPAFQTDGQFDIEKYRRFFTDPATDGQTLLQIENYYRSLLPRAKLETLVSSGIYVSDEEAWQFYRDTNESARVRYVRVDPAAVVPDADVSVTDAEIRARYNEERDELTRPAEARANMVSVQLRPTSADSAEARARAIELRDRVTAGEDFADVAMAESGDSLSAIDGGSLGKRPRTALDPALADAAYALSVGEVSDPIETSFGLHVIRVDERSQDSVTLRQIFVGIEPSVATEDSLFRLLDDLEDIALRQDLVSAADSLGLPVRTDVQLTDGVSFIPGAGQLGVAPDWALQPTTEIGEVSQFFENATGWHIFELLGRTEEGRIPLAEATPRIRQALTQEKKRERAREVAAGLTEAIEGGASLDEAAARMGWSVEETEPFRRGDLVPGLGQGTEAIGAAFGLPVGTVSRVLGAGPALAVIEVVERNEVTREDFEPIKPILLSQIRSERTQDYVRRWLLALRENATVEDHRAVLEQAADEQAQQF